MYQIITSPALVFPFVNEREPIIATAGMQAIGLENDGEIVAGVVFERINACNAWVHIALEDGWLHGSRQFLRACFAYPFKQLKLKRLSGYVEAKNHAARTLDEHLGFKQEAVLHGAAHDGGDILIYVMHREDCRYV